MLSIGLFTICKGNAKKLLNLLPISFNILDQTGHILKGNQIILNQLDQPVDPFNRTKGMNRNCLDQSLVSIPQHILLFILLLGNLPINQMKPFIDYR